MSSSVDAFKAEKNMSIMYLNNVVMGFRSSKSLMLTIHKQNTIFFLCTFISGLNRLVLSLHFSEIHKTSTHGLVSKLNARIAILLRVNTGPREIVVATCRFPNCSTRINSGIKSLIIPYVILSIASSAF